VTSARISRLKALFDAELGTLTSLMSFGFDTTAVSFACNLQASLHARLTVFRSTARFNRRFGIAIKSLSLRTIFGELTFSNNGLT
jgi:hypothetical protein